MFGPGSLLYESYGDRRGYLVAPVTGLLQLMYPPLGRGVEEHSAFFGEPLQRLFRSVPQIQGSIFDGAGAAGTATQIRDFHRGIKGNMPDGSRYHALDPDTYFWAHATFIDALYRMTDLFFPHRLSPAQREAVYAEGVQWWQMYGLSMRPVPPSYRDFREYWDHTVKSVLEPTPAAQELVAFMRSGAGVPQPWLPRPVWQLLAPTASLAWTQVGIGAMPPSVREMFGFPWTAANEAAFQAFRRAVTQLWPLLPERLRIMPRARTAYHRDGRLGWQTALDLAGHGAPATVSSGSAPA